jgi:hypothetical protein
MASNHWFIEKNNKKRSCFPKLLAFSIADGLGGDGVFFFLVACAINKNDAIKCQRYQASTGRANIG